MNKAIPVAPSSTGAPSSHSELGDFLRARRLAFPLDAAMLAQKKTRRTPGLRREEVAERAGIGVDWYIRLEQGRCVNPSVRTLDALAQALKLSEVERHYLRNLAQSPEKPRFEVEEVPTALSQLIHSLPNPAYVTGRRWDVLDWNAATAELFPEFASHGEKCNLLLFMLTSPAAQALFGPFWEAEAQRMIAIFRPTYDLWASDPAFISLVEQLKAGCVQFGSWWEAHAIRSTVGTRKQLQHPTRGALCFDAITFQSNDDPRLKLALYTPCE